MNTRARWMKTAVLALLLALACAATVARAGSTNDEWFNAVAEGDVPRVKALLQANADVNAKSRGGTTALMLAAQQGRDELLGILLRAGARVNDKNGDGQTALMLALKKGNYFVLAPLVDAGARLEARCDDCLKALGWAAEDGRIDYVLALQKAGVDINARLKDGYTTLMYALTNQTDRNVAELLAVGPDVNARSDDGSTPLMVAADCRKWLHGKAGGRVQALLEANASINAKRNDGSTALMLAAEHGCLAEVQALLKAKANVNARRNDGSTALIQAMERDQIYLLKVLLDAGADVYARRNDGATAIGAPTRITEAFVGAFCECNSPDAFPGVAKLFTRTELNDIKEKFETYDQRHHIDRTNPRYNALKAIGQVLVFRENNGKLIGFATGVLVGDDLVLTNAHVGQKVGQQIKFNIGQTPDDSTAKWADTSAGTVISMGAYNGQNDAHDWALVRLNKPLGKTFGKLTPYAFDTTGQLIDAAEKAEFIAAGFPGLKDPKYLWGKVNTSLDGRDMVKSSASSGMSGGAILWEYQPGKFKLVGLITGSTGRNDQVLLKYGHLAGW